MRERALLRAEAATLVEDATLISDGYAHEPLPPDARWAFEHCVKRIEAIRLRLQREAVLRP